ncbi:hypothetical protein P775_06960 [Puniceibacterium antarcticum]|uniref:Uncharacterized protein n=1 Tax=Puniceibacterium antarcticum TaxID=1206336 RepID=A0A2G8RH51_9RHOB|nr:hypothetical protein P775_06960 [Puniceibacterium antarcticum]
MSQILTVGLDLAKSLFQVLRADGAGRAILRMKLRRAQVLEFFSPLPSCVVAMEAFSSGAVSLVSCALRGVVAELLPRRIHTVHPCS